MRNSIFHGHGRGSIVPHRYGSNGKIGVISVIGAFRANLM
jgi:hypothetical protein